MSPLSIRLCGLLGLFSGCLALESEPNEPTSSHWSFHAPKPQEPPAVRDAGWVRSPIDAFILARLEREGLSPAPAIGRAQLIRRLSLDLTGLPPTPAETQAFLDDASPDAERSLIDRLLSSPRAAEHWTRDWLDLARYADSNGYQVDLERNMWPWRDWVIAAFDRNMPFDRFTIAQLAGDLVDGGKDALATGYNRNHCITTEGGVIDEEYRTIYAVDRVNTIASTWLGLTTGCARCHDHKYDPMTQRDFYRIMACFNQIGERGSGDGGNFGPMLEVQSPLDAARLAAIDAELKALPADLDQRIEEAEEEAEEELREGAPIRWEPANALSAASESGRPITSQADGVFLAPAGELDTFTLLVRVPLGGVRALRIEAQPESSLPGGGPGQASDGSFALSELSLWVLGPEGRRQIPLIEGHSLSTPAAAYPAIDGSGSTSWSGGPGASGAVFALAEPIDVRSATVALQLSELEGGGKILGRFRVSFSEHPLAALPPTMDQAILRPPGQRSPEETQALLSHYGLHLAPPELKAAARRRLELSRQRALASARVSVMTMKQADTPQDTFVLGRGDYQQHGEPVSCRPPQWILKSPAAQPRDRLGFAQWLVDPRHPLTARVVVNRLWQRYFGVGLVKTLDDFGIQGDRPSHPELLDYLALELVSSGWDLRHIHRLIVSSATYRQSSVAPAELEERDPENRLLARGARYRLPAEVIRDVALWAGGLLDETRGGPSVLPYQPPGLWEELNDRPGNFTPYRTDSGARTRRRSLYTFWKRSLPPPTLATFDAPSRETAVVRRSITTTPLQALVLLDAPEMLEAACGLAARMAQEGGADEESRLRHGFQLVTSRPPSEAELSLLKSAHRAQHAEMVAAPDAARTLVMRGVTVSPLAIEAQAALIQVARILLNLSETITRE